MLDKDYIDQMGKKYDYFTYYIKFKKACFHLPTPLKKKEKKGGWGEKKGVRPYSEDNYLPCTAS